MRKIFLFLSAVLVSMTIQATVVTQNFDLSGTSNYGSATVSGGTITDAADWAGAQLWQWTEGALAYDHVVLEVSDHDYPILLKVTYSGSHDDIAEQIEMPAANNSVAIEITHDIIKGIAVLNWSEHTDVDITITGLYMRGAVGIRKNVTIWSGTKAFDEFDWANRLLMSADKFADLHVGDILEVYYTTNAESYHQFDVKTNYDNAYPAFAPAQITLGGSNESGVLRFYIAESSDLSNIASQGGLYLNGKYITFTQVSVIKHEVLWTGTQEVGNWSGGQSIAWGNLTDLKVGNILCVRVTAGEYAEGEYNQVFCSYKSDWSGTFSPSVNYLFQVGDVMPMTVEIPVTYRMMNQLKGEQLNIGGKNYTMTDIYVKEGSPVNTVAAYLNVSSAGMATYVLPFSVPALPVGVQAYELTNDGSEVIMATEVSALTADEPVLIVAAEGEYEFVSEEGASDDISGKTGTYAHGALIGTYSAIDPLEQTTAGNYNYILQNGTDGVAFYQVQDASCSVAPYRAYLSCGYSPAPGAPARKMRLVFHDNAPTGIENTNASAIHSGSKILRNGQLFILRDGRTYSAQGQPVK